MPKYLTAIAIYGQRAGGCRGELVNPVFLKYRNIVNQEATLTRFIKFLETRQPNFQYANFYDKQTREFQFRRSPQFAGNS